MPIRQSRRCCAARHADPPVVEKGAAAPRSGEEIVADRVEDHALRDHALVRERDRHAVLREAVQEVGRAVEWIDDPQVLGVGVAAAAGAFLGEDRVLRIEEWIVSTIAASAARSTSLTKSFGPLAVTVRRSRSRAPRVMTLPARRAALTAVVSIGCMRPRAARGGRVACQNAENLHSTVRVTAPRGASRTPAGVARERILRCRRDRRPRGAPRAVARRSRPDEPAGEHRCDGARDAYDGHRPSRARASGALPDADATALASGATAVLDRARVVPTLEAALAGTRMSIALTARPREFAGDVMPLRRRSGSGDRHGCDCGSRARLRHGDVGTDQRRGRAMYGGGDDRDESGVSIAERRCGGAGCRMGDPRGRTGRPRLVGATVRAGDHEDIEALHAHARRRSPHCDSSTPHVRADCCHDCDGCSGAPASSVRK